MYVLILLCKCDKMFFILFNDDENDQRALQLRRARFAAGNG